jgi:hypothetical protein
MKQSRAKFWMALSLKGYDQKHNTDGRMILEWIFKK